VINQNLVEIGLGGKAIPDAGLVLQRARDAPAPVWAFFRVVNVS
jgi:hypothetical protein